MSYGKFHGVENYLVMAGKKADDLDERIGYYGELLVLLAKSPGVGGKAKVLAKKGFSMVGYTKMDLGIAKLHFEIGAGTENFEWE